MKSLENSNTIITLKYNNYYLILAKSTVHVQIWTVVSGSSDGREFACHARDLVQSLGQVDPLEKEMANHSNILVWRIPWTEEPGGLLSMESQKVGHY